MALLVLVIMLCNLGAMYNLYAMHRQLRRNTCCCPRDLVQPGAGQRQASRHSLEELDHLQLLALMTVLFTMCSLPLIVSLWTWRLRGSGERRATCGQEGGWSGMDAALQELRPWPGRFDAVPSTSDSLPRSPTLCFCPEKSPVICLPQTLVLYFPSRPLSPPNASNSLFR